MRLRGFFLSVFLFILSIHSSSAQSPVGTISGIVVDPSGAAIAGAEILVVNDETRVQYPGKSNEEGIYLVSNLPPGSYRIQVSKSGFKTIIKPDITLNVQDAFALNFTLPLGAVSEIVTIVGGAPLVNTESASVGTVIDRQFVETLPLNGRSFNTLLQLTPGVIIAPASSTSPGQFSIAGQRSDANYVTVDGVSGKLRRGFWWLSWKYWKRFHTVVQCPWRHKQPCVCRRATRISCGDVILRGGIRACARGQVILVTRSGTNDFHGEVFDYFRNTVMDANDWFANQVGNPRAAEHHNDFGGVFGGPIWKNRTFFFFSYEGARLDLPQTAQIEVPSAYARQTAPPPLSPFLAAFPLPNDNTVTPGVFTASFTGTYPNQATLNATSLRIDHALSNRFLIFGRYNYAPSSIQQRANSLSNVNRLQTNTQTLTVGLNMMLSSSLSNSVRGNYSTQWVQSSYTLDSFGGAVPISPSGLLGPLSVSDSLGYFTLSDASSFFIGPYTKNKVTQYNFTDDLSLSKGSHNLKFGGDYRDIFLDQSVYQNGLYYYGPTVSQFLATSTISLSSGMNKPSQVLSQSLSLYGQDNWKINSRLTLTYGLRWELNPAPSPRHGTLLAAWENVDDPANLALAPFGTKVYGTRFANFAPRTGVAFKLNQSGTAVLRAGWGIFYDLGSGAAASIGAYFPNSSDEFTTNLSFPVANPSVYIPPLSTNPPYGIVQAMDPNLSLPRSYQWNVALEKSFAGQVVSATYVGQAGKRSFEKRSNRQTERRFLQRVPMEQQ